MASSPSEPLVSWKSPISPAYVAPHAATAAPALHHPIRSCTSCKTRRVRCDRQQPTCGNCARAHGGLGQDCIYPTGRGRAPKRRRNPGGSAVDEQLIAERLARLEAMIRQAGQHGQLQIGHDSTAAAYDSSSTTSSHQVSVGHVITTPDSTHEGRFGRLKVTETNSHYLNDAMWGGLIEEVEELRSLLLEPSSDDEVDSDGPMITMPSDGNTKAMPATSPSTILFGLGTGSSTLHESRPSLVQAAVLFAAFCENVAPVMRLMHLPTLTRRYWNAAAAPDNIDHDTQTLVYAVNYVSVASLNEEQCVAKLGQVRHHALALYRAAVEQTLAQAHFLNTRSPTLLQAAVFYIEALQKSEKKAGQTAAVRSLVVLVHHLARTMGLHRDGAAYSLSPFKAEMRRRLWWYICILDHRTAEVCGAEPIVRPRSFDARLPLHVNDTDLSQEMSTLPPECKNETTDMTFLLIRYETLKTVWRVNDDGVPLAEKQVAIQELEHRLQHLYLGHCSPDVPFQLRMLLAGRMIAKRLWFMALWPSREKDSNRRQTPQNTTMTSDHGAVAMRDQLFAAAVNLLEAAADILGNPTLSPWLWHAQTYSQWHALAFVLHELRHRPSSPESERAWQYARTVYESWLVNSTASNLRRPISSLFEKVRLEREDGVKSNKTFDDAGGEPDSGNSLDLFWDTFQAEFGDANDPTHTLMAESDMTNYFLFDEDSS
ncbi:bikaverin cluster-transcription factor [Apiospora arundinis]